MPGYRSLADGLLLPAAVRVSSRWEQAAYSPHRYGQCLRARDTRQSRVLRAAIQLCFAWLSSNASDRSPGKHGSALRTKSAM